MSSSNNKLKIIQVLKPKKSFLQIEKYVASKFRRKNFVSNIEYNSSIINNIIYNEKTKIVAKFKDYLILDDVSEFLKRYYSRRESAVRLPKFFEYYETYSKIYPNYTSLYEGKFIYRNIQRKQRMIDLQERMEMEAKRKKKKINSSKEISDEVFSTEVYDSIINDRNNEDMEILFGIKNNISDGSFYDKANAIIETIEKNEILINQVNSTSSVISQSKSQSKNLDSTQNQKKTERSLIEKIELNLFKKNRIFRNNKSLNDFNKVLGSSLLSNSLSKKTHLGNIKSNESLPYSNRSNGGITSANDILKTPSTDRVSGSKMKPKGDNTNIIYIINQNPKFTTQVNVFNNSTTRPKMSMRAVFCNAATSSHSNPKHKTTQSSNCNSNSKFPLGTQSMFVLKNQNKQREKIKNIKKRNTSANFNNQTYYQMLKTTREMSIKEGNLLRSTHYFANNRNLNGHHYNMGTSSGFHSKRESSTNSGTSKGADVKKMSRNRIEGTTLNSNNRSTKNYLSRNDSLTKIGIIGDNLMSKKVKGIKIKNFSKIFNINLSQLQTRTERSKFGK